MNAGNKWNDCIDRNLQGNRTYTYK